MYRANHHLCFSNGRLHFSRLQGLCATLRALIIGERLLRRLFYRFLETLLLSCTFFCFSFLLVFLFFFISRRQLYRLKEPLTITVCSSFQNSRGDMTSFGYGDLLSAIAIRLLISLLIVLLILNPS